MSRHARHARMVWHDPRSLGTLIRQGLLGLWRARGGGLYGLGYVVAFVLLEVKVVVGEFAGSEGVIAFLGDQLLEYLLRLGLMSFVNVVLAFLWPLLLLERLGVWGLLLLPAAYLLFERWLRPRVEAAFPELRRTSDAPGKSST